MNHSVTKCTMCGKFQAGGVSRMSIFSNPTAFQNIGVRSAINATGTNTRSGGTRVYPEVIEAMMEVANVGVDMFDLNDKVGDIIARLTGAEAGLVSSGASGGMMLQAAACIAGTDPAKIARLPDTHGMKTEISIYRGHRIWYDQAWRKAGASLVEFGDMRDCFPWQLEATISPNTVAVAYVVGPWLHHAALPLEDVCRIAHKNDVPVIVDAAAMLPPKANLRKYLEAGADLVAYSGGKGVRGPQGTGILIGKKELIKAAAANASPNHGIGRSLKVSKEEIVGLATALDVFLKQDEEKEMNRWRRQCTYIVESVAELSGIRSRVEHDGINRVMPHAVVYLDQDWKGPSTAEVANRLKIGNPSIIIGRGGWGDELWVRPVSLTDDEIEVVANRMREALTEP